MNTETRQIKMGVGRTNMKLFESLSKTWNVSWDF